MTAVSPAEADQHRQLVAAWFEEYQAPLFRYLLRLVGDEQHAADLLQDTFVRALAALPGRAPPLNPFAWLYRIATHTAYNALRRRKRWRWITLSGREPAPGFENTSPTRRSSAGACCACAQPRPRRCSCMSAPG